MTDDHVNEEVQAETVETSAIQDESTESSAPTQTTEEFLENFDWVSYEEAAETVDEAKYKEFEKLVQDNFVDTQQTDVIKGTVTHMTDREAIIDINAKSEGVISLNEFRYNPDLKVGDIVEVIVDIREDKTGQLVL
jgi:small subunit ribosomal protein S1